VDQVRESVRTSRGNEWMFSARTVRNYPLRAPAAYTAADKASGLYSVGVDVSPVRADPSHAGWSDIFFLGMDFPEGARVINLSVDLAVHGAGGVAPPIEVYCRFIEQPVVRIVSLDLGCEKDVDSLGELFNFGNDHLGLLKAGVIASGIIPPCLENSGATLAGVLQKLFGRRGGFELVSHVREIPKGSRLAVSTTLLATIIARLMRFSGQIERQEGGLNEAERLLIASRAILGEWLGGSGGGWQDSGGIWPGIKVIQGVEAVKGDPEFGVSRGRLLPAHTVLAREQLPPDIDDRFERALVMVHGGLSMNVGPILEMVTTRYLLRYRDEWKARLLGYDYFSQIVEACKTGDMKKLGRLTTLDWEQCTKVMIPWTSNAYTEDLIATVRNAFGKDYWGFLMLGGASGGGMAFIVNPAVHDRFRDEVLQIMRALKKRYEHALPFAMDPVVYDWRLNYRGNEARMCAGHAAVMPDAYYTRAVINALESRDTSWTCAHAAELDALAAARGTRRPDASSLDALKTFAHAALGIPASVPQNQSLSLISSTESSSVEEIKKGNGFDQHAHDRNKQWLKSGRIGVSKNRLPETTKIEDVRPEDVEIVSNNTDDPRIMNFRLAGQELLKRNAVGVVTFSGGLGSRWAEGAAVVKAINPFVTMKGRHRSFIEVHLAKSDEVMRKYEQPVQHVFTTSYLTHEPLRAELDLVKNHGYAGPVYLSRGMSISHRVYPLERDLRFLWEELSQQLLDERAQKVQNDVREALIGWARERGEGEDYNENTPLQRFNPPGHFFELPNMLRNGTLAAMLRENPGLEHLMVHNADTLGVFLSPIMIGMHH
ncbi:UTP--glucose-1-phosphate uridylyltransferase, partial [bacterium]|nr:UTP--glucose-1-phosphate uridylyltransferase [bacterium]